VRVREHSAEKGCVEFVLEPRSISLAIRTCL
jgi:hypothetical protein